MKNLNANNRRYLIVMYQHWFIDYNKCTIGEKKKKNNRKPPTLKISFWNPYTMSFHPNILFFFYLLSPQVAFLFSSY